MQLVYYRKRVPNFGDDLNPELWPALAPALFGDGKGCDPEAGFVGIGTIIGMPCAAARLHVFSSGVGYDPPERWRGKQVVHWCVRGPLSAQVLGLPPNQAMTDGAILAPFAPGFPQRASGTGGTVVVPHWESMLFPGWPEAAALAGFTLIDPREHPRDVIHRIAGAGLVLTESLHGAILADTYGIPWIAFATSQNFSAFKWADWTLSVGLDLAFVSVPPPSAEQVPRFGRPPRPYGTTASYDAEAAVAQFGARQHPAVPTLRSRAKQTVMELAVVQQLLGFSPARTAEALAALSCREATVSAESTRQELQSKLLDRLSELQAAYRPS